MKQKIRKARETEHERRREEEYEEKEPVKALDDDGKELDEIMPLGSIDQLWCGFRRCIASVWRWAISWNLRRTAIVGLLALGVVFALFVWPTRYRYEHSQFRVYGGKVAQKLVRIDRLTGQTWVLEENGWRNIREK